MPELTDLGLVSLCLRAKEGEGFRHLLYHPSDRRLLSQAIERLPALLARIRELENEVVLQRNDIRTRCLRVAQDQARQLDEMGEHEMAKVVITVASRIEAIP